MKIETDTLRYARMLVSRGVEATEAEAIVETLTDMELRNLYNKQETDTMMNASFKNTLLESRREFDKELDRRNKEFDKRIELMEKNSDKDIADARSGRRWLIGIIISCTLALAGLIWLH